MLEKNEEDQLDRSCENKYVRRVSGN